MALKAGEKHDKKTATELMSLKISSLQMQNYDDENLEQTQLQYLADKLVEDKEIQYVKLTEDSNPTLEHIDTTGYSSFFTKLKDYPYEFEINSSSRIASVENYRVSREKYEELKNQYNELLEKYNELEQKPLNYKFYYCNGFVTSNAGVFYTQKVDVPKDLDEFCILTFDSSTWGCSAPTFSGSIITSAQTGHVKNHSLSGVISNNVYRTEIKTNGDAGSINVSFRAGGNGKHAAQLVMIYK